MNRPAVQTIRPVDDFHRWLEHYVGDCCAGPGGCEYCPDESVPDWMENLCEVADDPRAVDRDGCP